MVASDPRIPVRFGALHKVAPDAALLLEGDMTAPLGAPSARFVVGVRSGHQVGCACCLSRGPVAEAFSRLYLARARGEAPLFAQVLAITTTSAGRRAVADALAADMLTKARFRLA